MNIFLQDAAADCLTADISCFQDTAGHILLIPSSSESIKSKVNSDWFLPAFWNSTGNIAGQSKGRHTTWFINAPERLASQFWVLRHYYRGGLVAKINHDKYFYTGLENTRCYQEIKLLMEMVELDLPVPKPIAARVIKKGLFYRADLLMDKLEAKDLVAKLSQAPLSVQSWQNIGSIIADFHRQDIYHADLNAHNILIDDAEKIWLIDFDRCRKQTLQTGWQSKNLQRLQRSFLKEKTKHQNLNFTQEDWLNLKNGYWKTIGKQV